MNSAITNYYPTGNEYISIPTLNESGDIESINVLSMRHRGLLEMCGDMGKAPLMSPIVKVDGTKHNERKQWSRLEHWIPSWMLDVKGIQVESVICAPMGEKAFYYSYTLKNSSKERKKVTVGFTGTWAITYHTVNEQKRMRTEVEAYKSLWNEGMMFEMYGETPLLALCPMSSHPLTIEEFENKNRGVVYTIETEVDLSPGEEEEITFYWGVGLEEVSAATAAKELMRQTRKKVESKTREWLFTRKLKSSDKELESIINLNSFFNYFYAIGNTYDTEELVLVTSRSPRYYVSAAYWDRDSMLWSFPNVLHIDHQKAKEMLLYVFKKQWRNRGIHSRFIDGTVLEPGFELDELCAPFLALDKYIQSTDDSGILDELNAQQLIDEFLSVLMENKHSIHALYRTFLQPTDDPVVYPYLTYNNVLVWRTLEICSRWSDKRRTELHSMAEMTKEAIWNYMITNNGEGQKIFSWATDLKGGFHIYDEPPGSLQLLPYYGFCSKDEPVLMETIKEIRSEKNKYSFKGKQFEELGCSHAEHPWVLGIANSLLSGRKEEAKDLLLRAPLDNGIACESFHEETGVSTTGEHFATCAGFLAYALYEAFGEKKVKHHVKN
ncbi:glycoside hydrolase family 125 protein [Evansella tamaricis]|uniref:Glycoside hydrolase family 125 protein n=1 Tax=Evansella tamaricis TaxID=2069301 RepID=A0ABS6JJL9_9BACI|nr:glycoside hydrolase family 125 protein [Evansella tamaricis]MBU9713879.1 glycoside hydrolase family 125 protein [Evansella tamaricis]